MASTVSSTNVILGPVLQNLDLLEAVDTVRQRAFGGIPQDERSQKGQFGTPPVIARLMASMFDFRDPEIRLLDAGAGVGSLTAAFVEAACGATPQPRSIHVTAYEIEPRLIVGLKATLARCEAVCEQRGIAFTAAIRTEDFIDASHAESLLFTSSSTTTYNYAIGNPPYRKLRSDSRHRKRLSAIGIEVSNLYAAFLALTARALEEGGQLVAITPRSFCNGPYFKHFREYFLGRMSLRRLHVFESRSEAFADDAVLQENIILVADRGLQQAKVTVSSTSGSLASPDTEHPVDYALVVPDGATPFIHLITDDVDAAVVRSMQRFTSSLSEVGVEISTGRVVDFRAKPLLLAEPVPGAYPLIYPVHLRAGGTQWPVDSRKDNALANGPGVDALLVPPGVYVLIKRFSSKEQRRRIEAFVYDSEDVAPGAKVGFENHLNYLHVANQGLDKTLAVGLAVYLNSTLADLYFRLFSGHTQVNATDLRRFPFPSRDELIDLGQRAGGVDLPQARVDELLREIFSLPEDGDPVARNQRVSEAQRALQQLGLPKKQQNERSALVLLALLDLTPADSWSDASAPKLGITEMMQYFAEHYGKAYAPNTRETVRRQTVHQFLDAGLIVQNPDAPDRPVNSGNTVYQLIPQALNTLQTFGTDEWEQCRDDFLSDLPALRESYAQVREMERIAVTFNNDFKLELSPGGQNVLVKEIIAEFVPRFAPNSVVVYVGDAEDKDAYVDDDAFERLGIAFDRHGKFPDVVVHYKDKNWLLLIEAVTSHGPVDPKRHRELKELFAGATAGLVFVTTFMDRKTFGKYMSEIAWETEVWIAESPGHMIHFDGERFLGPYVE